MFKNANRIISNAIGKPKNKDIDRDLYDTISKAIQTGNLVDEDTIRGLEQAQLRSIKANDQAQAKQLKAQVEAAKKIAAMQNSEGRTAAANALRNRTLDASDVKELTKYIEVMATNTDVLKDVIQTTTRDMVKTFHDILADDSVNNTAKYATAQDLLKVLSEMPALDQSEAYKKLLDFMQTNADINNTNSDKLEDLVSDVVGELNKLDGINDLVDILQDANASNKDQQDALDKMLLTLQDNNKYSSELLALRDIANDNKGIKNNLGKLAPVLSRVADSSMQTRTLYTLQQIENNLKIQNVNSRNSVGSYGNLLGGGVSDTNGNSGLNGLKTGLVQLALHKLGLGQLDAATGGALSDAAVAATTYGAIKGGGWAKGKWAARTGSPTLPGGKVNAGAGKGGIKNMLKGVAKSKNKALAIATAAAGGYYLLSGKDSNAPPTIVRNPNVTPPSGTYLDQTSYVTDPRTGEPLPIQDSDADQYAYMQQVMDSSQQPVVAPQVDPEAEDNTNLALIGGAAITALAAKNMMSPAINTGTPALPPPSNVSTAAKVGEAAKTGSKAKNFIKAAKGKGGGLTVALGAAQYALADNTEERVDAVSSTGGALVGGIAGAKGGAAVGAAIGAFFGGVGAAPGAAIGGIIGGIGGAIVGSDFGSWIGSWFTSAEDLIPDTVKEQGKVVEAAYIDQMLQDPDLSEDTKKDLRKYQKELLSDKKSVKGYIASLVGDQIGGQAKLSAIQEIMLSQGVNLQHPEIYKAVMEEANSDFASEKALQAASAAMANITSSVSKIKEDNKVVKEPSSEVAPAEVDALTMKTDKKITRLESIPQKDQKVLNEALDEAMGNAKADEYNDRGLVSRIMGFVSNVMPTGIYPMVVPAEVRDGPIGGLLGGLTKGLSSVFSGLGNTITNLGSVAGNTGLGKAASNIAGKITGFFGGTKNSPAGFYSADQFKTSSGTKIDKNADISGWQGGGTSNVTGTFTAPTISGANAYDKKYLATNIAKGNTGIGMIPSLFESGTGGVHVVSSGAGDHGGVSYGKHQLASANGRMTDFMMSKYAQPFAQEFAGMRPGSAEFTAKYKEVTSRNPELMEKAQDDYNMATHFVPFMNKMQKKTGHDFSKRSNAVQEMLHTMALQYGPGSEIGLQAFNGLDLDNISDADLIRIGQDYRIKTVDQRFKSSSQAVKQGVANRFVREKDLLLEYERLQREGKIDGLAPALSQGGSAANTTPVESSTDVPLATDTTPIESSTDAPSATDTTPIESAPISNGYVTGGITTLPVQDVSTNTGALVEKVNNIKSQLAQSKETGKEPSQPKGMAPPQQPQGGQTQSKPAPLQIDDLGFAVARKIIFSS